MHRPLFFALVLVVAGLAITLISLEDTDSQSDTETQIELRVSAKRLADGRTEFALQRRQDDAWGERLLPSGRILSANPPVDSWRNSTPVTIAVPEIVREIEVEVEVIKEVEVEVEVVREVEVYTPPSLDALPEMPEDWLPLNHDRTSERTHRGRAWQMNIAAHAEWTSVWEYSDSFTSDVSDFLAVQLTCNVENSHPTWVLRLPNHIFGDSDEVTVEYFVGESITYTQEFLRRSEAEQDTSWTTWEDATTVLSLIHQHRPSFNHKDFSIRVLGEDGVVHHELATYFLYRLASSDSAPDPLDSILYCGQYGPEESQAADGEL